MSNQNIKYSFKFLWFVSTVILEKGRLQCIGHTHHRPSIRYMPSKEPAGSSNALSKTVLKTMLKGLLFQISYLYWHKGFYTIMSYWEILVRLLKECQFFANIVLYWKKQPRAKKLLKTDSVETWVRFKWKLNVCKKTAEHSRFSHRQLHIKHYTTAAFCWEQLSVKLKEKGEEAKTS